MANELKPPCDPLTAPLPPHIAAMMRPAFYRASAASVDFRQTHISYFFLVGTRVFKVKKPVCFPFLDATALNTRRRLCFEEVRLNRRLAPDVYLGVRPILAQVGTFALGDALQSPQDEARQSAVDYTVEMRRLPDDRMLDRLVRQGKAGLSEIRSIADRLATFHRTAASESAGHYGSAASVSRMVAENLKECE